MKTLLNTLYVTNPDAYLRLDGNTICVEIEDKKFLQVPLHHIGSVVCFGGVVMTAPLMNKCTSSGKSVVFLTRRGDLAARVEGPVTGNVLLRLSQFRSFSDPKFALELSRNIIAGKLRNCRQIVMRGARESQNDQDASTLARISDLLMHLLKKLEQAATLNELRGVEGEAARLYFSSINSMIRADKRDSLGMTGRSRRPPLDPFNALLSFLYTLLMTDCRAALECVGLDSQVGYLHCLRPGRPALALDLMEEFRPLLADKLALTLINRAQIKEADFEIRPGGAVSMSDESRKTVISAYQKRKQEEVTHSFVEEPVSLGLIIHLQARILARVIRKDMESYIPFLYR